MKRTHGTRTRSSQKPRNLLNNTLKITDLVFELVDARCPLSSRSPLVKKLIAGKRQLLILNKADLADPVATKQWLLYFQREGRASLAVDSRKGEGFQEVWEYLNQSASELIQILQKKGCLPRELRTAVIGVPNVGKSTFLNKIIGRRSAATGDRPGVTKGPQWVHLHGKISILDTPGVLPPQLKDEEVVFKLAATGVLDKKTYNLEKISEKLIKFLEVREPGSLSGYLDVPPGSLSLQTLALKKKFLLPDGLADLHRAAGFLLHSFQGGKFGSFTLELPD
ncbi:MAG: ribosome biogenesis GTPase YlqF [Bacillota bacterium]|nr:ribosome biogenesis GTPase YlqF [Bacillota bacterium]